MYYNVNNLTVYLFIKKIYRKKKIPKLRSYTFSYILFKLENIIK